MPASRSRSPSARTQALSERQPAFWPLILIGAIAALAVLTFALPASVAARFLPRTVKADQLSGSIWHGVAGIITVDGRGVGGVEWTLHPAGLLRMALDIDLHWVNDGLSVHANAQIRRSGLLATGIRGGALLQDLHAFGVPPGWRGTAAVALSSLTSDFTRITSLTGDVRIANLASPQVADGSNLGGYALHFPQAAVNEGDVITAQAQDTGGPIQLQAIVTVAPKERRGTISGTVLARSGAAPALAAAVDDLAQLRGRDQLGRVPLDLEFSY